MSLEWSARRRAYREQHRPKERAHRAIATAIKRGTIPPAARLLCVECKQPAMLYHHPNGYEGDRQYDVVPMCRPCHTKAHHPDTYPAPALVALARRLARFDPAAAA